MLIVHQDTKIGQGNFLRCLFIVLNDDVSQARPGALVGLDRIES